MSSPISCSGAEYATVPTVLFDRHSGGVSVGKNAGTVDTVDVVHRDPQLALELTSIVDADDVRVMQSGREIGLTEEPGAIFRISRDVCR